MHPELSNGAINWIVNGANVVNAVIQILGCKKIPGAGNDRYRLLISDGVTGFPFGMLGTQLNHMVTNKELDKFTIVQVNKYTFHQVQPDKKVIILLKLTVLVPGNKVNEKLGNPVAFSTHGVAIGTTNVLRINGDAETSYSTDNAMAAHETSMFSSSLLTFGAIGRILNGEDVANAVVQILGIKKSAGTPDRYHLLIFDGVTGWPFVMLATHLNCMVANKELEKFTVMQVDKYVYNQETSDQKMIILLKITILSPANENKEKFNSPTGPSLSSSSSNAPTANFVAGAVTKQHAASAHYLSMITGYARPVLFTQFLYTMFPEVASGAVNRILNGEVVTNAVIQILSCRKLLGVGNPRYRLLISDGVTGCPYAMLGTQLNHMVTNNELQKFTIVRVEKYKCNPIQAEQKMITLLNLTVLIPGTEVNEKLGNPTNSSTENYWDSTDTSALNNDPETGYTSQNGGSAPDSSIINGSASSVHSASMLYKNKCTIESANAPAVNDAAETCLKYSNQHNSNKNAVSTQNSSKRNESSLSVPFNQL